MSTIAGVAIHPLKRIGDERGMVLHMLRANEPHFVKFGEIYFSQVVPGAIKAWRKHSRVTLNYAVPIGTIRLVLFDDRKNSPTRGQIAQLQIGEKEYSLVTIPPGIWSGFCAEGTSPALVANCATEPHDDGEAERRDPHTPLIPYQW